MATNLNNLISINFRVRIFRIWGLVFSNFRVRMPKISTNILILLLVFAPLVGPVPLVATPGKLTQ